MKQKIKKGEITKQYNMFKRLYNIEIPYDTYYRRLKSGYADIEIIEILKVGYRTYICNQRKELNKQKVAEKIKELKSSDIESKKNYSQLSQECDIMEDHYYLAL